MQDVSVDWSDVSRTIVGKWKELTLDSNAAQGTEYWPALWQLDTGPLSVMFLAGCKVKLLNLCWVDLGGTQAELGNMFWPNPSSELFHWWRPWIAWAEMPEICYQVDRLSIREPSHAQVLHILNLYPMKLKCLSVKYVYIAYLHYVWIDQSLCSIHFSFLSSFSFPFVCLQLPLQTQDQTFCLKFTTKC